MHYSYGDVDDYIIVNDEEKQKEFMKDRQKNYARFLHKNIDEIIILKPRLERVNFNVLVKNSN